MSRVRSVSSEECSLEKVLNSNAAAANIVGLRIRSSPKKIRDSIRSLASGHKVIRAAQLVDMLICHGGMRPGSVHIFPEVSKATGKMFQMGEAADPADGVPVVNLLGTFCRTERVPAALYNGVLINLVHHPRYGVVLPFHRGVGLT